MAHRFATIAAHAGRVDDQAGQPVTSPISLSTTFLQSGPGAAAKDTRTAVSVTQTGMRSSIAWRRSEGGSSASVFSSGCAAMHAVLQLLCPGDQLVACGDIYGGTYRLIEQLVKPMGIDVAWVDMSDLAAVEPRSTNGPRWSGSKRRPTLCFGCSTSRPCPPWLARRRVDGRGQHVCNADASAAARAWAPTWSCTRCRNTSTGTVTWSPAW